MARWMAGSSPAMTTGKREQSRASGMTRDRRFEPASILWLLLVLVLLFLVGGPLLKLLAVSFEQRDGGGFTFGNYLAAYGRLRYLEALGNSLLLGLSSSAIAV